MTTTTADTFADDVATLEHATATGCLLHTDAERIAGIASRVAWRIMRDRSPGAALDQLGARFREWSGAAWIHFREQSGRDCPRAAAIAYARHVLHLLRPAPVQA